MPPSAPTKPAGTGTGLGLTISRTIVEGFGGELSAESPPGGGARLRVKLQTWAQRRA